MTTQRQTSDAIMFPRTMVTGTGDESGQELELNRLEATPGFDWTDSGREALINGHKFRNGHHRSEIEQRFDKARASTLVDPACLYLLGKFPPSQALSVHHVDEILAGPLGWLKLCLLVNANLVEISGHDLRITSDGLSAMSEHQRIVSRPTIDDES